MLVHGVITPEELLDETDKGLLHVYQRTVTTKHVMVAIKAVELWFTDKPSGCHGLLPRMCTALHINNVLLHDLHGGGNILPVAAINQLSTAANKHKRTAKNDQNRKAAMRGLSMEAAICEPNNAQRICQQMIAYVETTLEKLATGCGKYMASELFPCITVHRAIVAPVAAMLNAITIASTMARKYAIVSARLGDVQPPLLSKLSELDACRIKQNKDKTIDTEGKVWAISQRMHKVWSNWALFWRLDEYENNHNCPLIPCWGGSANTRGTMGWCEAECLELLGLQHGATIADRVAAWKSAPPPVQRACQNALVECTQHSFSCQPSSTDINNEYAAIFDPENGFGVTMDTPVRITTQKWRAITFTASVLIWKRGAAGGGQTTPGMMGLAGARHPARMCKDIPEVKVSVSAAAGTAGANADVNYMLVPWPELCDADARTLVAAEAQLAGAVLGQHGSPTCGDGISTGEQHTGVASTPVGAARPACFEPSISATKQTKKHSKNKKKKKKGKERRSKNKKQRKLSYGQSHSVDNPGGGL